MINDAESGSVEVTLSGVDGDVDPDTGVVVTLTDANDASVTASIPRRVAHGSLTHRRW